MRGGIRKLGTVMLMVVGFATELRAEPPEPCTPEYLASLKKDQRGIEAFRTMGPDKFRGVCVAVRSIEGAIGRFGGNAVGRIGELLKKYGLDVDPNIVSTMCRDAHEYVDDLTVGQREREINRELERCAANPTVPKQ